MALNISTPIEKRGTTFTLNQDYKDKYHITVNEPSQTHFSVEGVQRYTPEEIKAIVEKVKNKGIQKEGTYVSVQTYKIDNEIEFLENAPSNKEKVSTIKAKSKAKLQLAKPVQEDTQEKKPKHPKISVRKEMAKTNQKLVKLTKQQEKLKRMEDRLSDLTKKYKEQFGDTLKPKAKKAKQQEDRGKQGRKGDEQSSPQKNNEDEQFACSEEEGEQALPSISHQKQGKSLASVTKPQQQDHDASFQEMQWEPKRSEPSSSRLKASTYSERLGNAVHLLF